MHSDKRNLIMLLGTSLISSFHQQQQLQRLHNGSTKAHFYSPLFSILFSLHVGDDLRYTCYGFGARAVLAGTHLMLFSTWNITQSARSSWK